MKGFSSLVAATSPPGRSPRSKPSSSSVSTASGRIGSLSDGSGVAQARQQLRRTVLPGPEKVAAIIASNRTVELLEMAIGMEDAAVALYERLTGAADSAAPETYTVSDLETTQPAATHTTSSGTSSTAP